jgi:hypothetical protein
MGERVYGAVPLGHWEVTTLIGAWALDGVRASFTVDAAADADVFHVFVEQALAPTLPQAISSFGTTYRPTKLRS